METFIEQWGYIAVFLGSLVEGESIILTAGFLASQGYLSLTKVILISFLGTLVADQALFFVGQYYGAYILGWFPKLKKPSQKAFELLHRYDTLYILSFRFIYGIRIVSPVIIGAAGITFRRFAYLNVVAAAIWSAISCSAGYLFGDFLMNRIDPFQRVLVIVAVILLLVAWLGWKFRKKIFKTKAGHPPPTLEN